jgi:hypothetical protein
MRAICVLIQIVALQPSGQHTSFSVRDHGKTSEANRANPAATGAAPYGNQKTEDGEPATACYGLHQARQISRFLPQAGIAVFIKLIY